MSAARVVLWRRRADRSKLSGSGRASPVAALALICLTASVFAAASPAFAALTPVGLGAAGSFAVLAGSGITNTGKTTITGDIGSLPTAAETGVESITLIGTDHGGDPVTAAAKKDLAAAYSDAVGRNPVINVAGELGGTTVVAGVYASPTFGLAGTLTLDAKGRADAEFIFQAGSTVTTEPNSRVLLINGADPCRVVWQVGSSATFKTATRFVGDVLVHTSITAQAGATFEGRLLALDGAVTMDTNTIAKTTCAPPGTDNGTAATTATAATPATMATAATPANPATTATAASPATVTPATTATITTPATTATAASTASLDLGAAVALAPVAIFSKSGTGPPTGTTGPNTRPLSWILSAPQAPTNAPPSLPSTAFISAPFEGLMGFWLALLAAVVVAAIALIAARRRARGVPEVDHIT